LIILKPHTLIEIKPLKDIEHPFAGDMLQLYKKLMLPAFMQDSEQILL